MESEIKYIREFLQEMKDEEVVIIGNEREMEEMIWEGVKNGRITVDHLCGIIEEVLSVAKSPVDIKSLVDKAVDMSVRGLDAGSIGKLLKAKIG